MAQWDSYEQKQTPDDNDTLLIKDSNAGTNKRTPLSGVWNYIKNKLNQDGQDYFVKKDQGQENSGKVLGIGEDGMVLPVDQESGTGGTVSVRVESTTTGEPGTDARVTNSGTAQNVVLNFVIPRGQKGDTGAKGDKGDKGAKGDTGEKGDTGADGKAATIRVGSVTTGDTAKVTNSGTETDAVFDFVIPQGGSGGGTPSDYETVKSNSKKIWIDETLSYSIESNKEDIFDAVENSKADKMQITDGSEYWDADEVALYPSVLNMKYLRTCRFYREMWLPNGLDITQSYRYAVDKNGQIRIYNIHDFAESFGGLSPWGIALKAEGQSFPSTPCHFICSAFRILGIDKTTGKWQLIKKARPIAALYTVAVTTEDDTVINVTRTELGNDMYSFAVNTPSNWTIDGDMCFHFFCQSEDAVTAEDVANYDKIMVVFRLKVQEEEHANKFTCSSGCDAYFSGSITEAFFGRFNGITTELKEFISHNILENESSVLADNMPYLNELLTDESSDSSSGGDSYVLPIMTNDRLGGGRAVAKTTETVPVAVDDDGKLWVPDQSGGSSEGSSSPYDGKTIVMFGDSIVAGWGWQDGKGVTEPLKEKYPAGTWINKAISGANMAEKSGASHASILSTVKGYMGEADYILLEGGTNDVNNGVPMGDAAAGYDASYNESSFCGALESALQIINDRYPLARKLFLIPHSFAKDNSYVDAIHDKAIEICEKWNMPILDMRKMSQIALTSANKAKYTRNPNTNQGDGVHPTETWYRAFYCPVVDQFMRSLGQYDGNVEPPENVPVTGVTLNQSSITLTSVGQTQQLQATVQPSNATNKSLTWESNHPEYATVTQSGLVKAVANGTAVITVETQDGNKTATCAVNVNIGTQPEEDHTELPKLTIDKNCYFDTGVKPSIDTNIELKVHVTSPDISGTWVFGVRDSKNKYTLSITNSWYCTRGSISSSAGEAPYWDGSSGWTIKQDGKTFDFNGTKVQLSDISSLDFSTSAYIGNANNNGSPYEGQGYNGEFYYCKMYNGSELVSDIIPVKKLDGTLCLYDKIGQKYLYNLGTGNLSE